MTSTTSPTQAEPRFDDGAAATMPGTVRIVPDPAATVPKDPFIGVEETLAKLAHKAASAAPDARPRTPAADKSADARGSQSSQSSAAPTLGPATRGPATLGAAPLGAPTLGPADLGAQIPREPRALGTIRTLANVVIIVCIGAAVIWGWRSYGGPARAVIAAFIPRSDLASARSVADQPAAAPATAAQAPAAQAPAAQAPDPAPAATPTPSPQQAAAPAAAENAAPPAQAASVAPPAPPAASEPAAPPADHQQIDAMARDLAALRQTVDQLTAGQEQLKSEIAKLQADKAAAVKPPPEKPKKHVVHHVPPADHPSDAFNPAQNPGAPGAPRTIGTVVERRAAPPYYAPPVTSSSLAPPPSSEVRRPPAPVPEPAPMPAPMPQ
jgi:pyruvate dehydrogenase E2 component (dihydrolipoamide acetyltransferase)